MIRTVLACLGFTLAGVVLTAWFWPALPEPMPTHWNAAGAPDGFMPRWAGVMVGPLMSLFMPLLVLGVSRLDPRREHVERSEGALTTIAVALSAFGLGIQWLILDAATSPDQALQGSGVLVMMGLLYLVLGNALTKARSNWFVGIRTPWTLQSEKVWHRTHRVGGWSFALAGVVTLVAAAGLGQETALWVSLASVGVASLVPVAYSYAIFEGAEA